MPSSIWFSLLVVSLWPLCKTVYAQTCRPHLYPIPEGIATRRTFDISIKVDETSWAPLQAYQVQLSEVDTLTGSSVAHNTSVAYFDFCDPVDVQLTYHGGESIETVQLRPLSLHNNATIDGNTIRFKIMKPTNLVVQVNDDIFDCLHLMSNYPDLNVLPANNSEVTYFGPGLHNLNVTQFNISSGHTVYLAGGAVLTARVGLYNITGASVRGRGVLYHPTAGAVSIVNSSEIVFDGIHVFNPKGNAIEVGMSNNVAITSLVSFSNAGWGDGVDIFSSANVHIENAFMRNSDDCIAIYTHRWDYWGNTTNVTVKESSLWADLAHPINIGTHGNTANPETLSQLMFKNIDILDHREPQVDYQGCLALNPGDNNLIEDVVADDIRVENFRKGQLVNMHIAYNRKYNTSPGRGIRNVTIKNMSYSGTNANTAVMIGYDEDRVIEFVRFQNLTINGQVISDTMRKPGWYSTSDMVPMLVNEHVKNLTFTAE